MRCFLPGLDDRSSGPRAPREGDVPGVRLTAPPYADGAVGEDPPYRGARRWPTLAPMNNATQYFTLSPSPGQRRVRALVAAVVATGALVGVPAASQAATAQVANVGTNGFLTYSAAAGEANSVIVSVSSGKILIRDTAPIGAGPGCEINAAGDALCRANVDGVSVALGDGNDVAQYLAPHAGGVFGQAGDDIINGGQRAAGPKGKLDLSGGDGVRDMITYQFADKPVSVSVDQVDNDGRLFDGENVAADFEIYAGSRFGDTLRGTNTGRIERFRGDLGNDKLFGLGGPDYFEEGASVNGLDTFNGGDGVDRVVYEERRNGVRVSFDGLNNDGETSEGDRVQSDVEGATGGSGDDVLSGNDQPNAFTGNAGSDNLTGGAGTASDVLIGGPGRDRMEGGEGSDNLIARDGESDRVDCGANFDTVSADNGLDTLIACP
jgi:Ca2+-binding RTX toxin-like protein